MKTTALSGLCTLGLLLTAPAMSQITFYEGEDFHGRAFTTRNPVTDLSRRGFNDRASSVIVESGQWQVCDDAGYRGRCVPWRSGLRAAPARALGPARLWLSPPHRRARL